MSQQEATIEHASKGLGQACIIRLSGSDLKAIVCSLKGIVKRME